MPTTALSISEIPYDWSPSTLLSHMQKSYSHARAEEFCICVCVCAPVRAWGLNWAAVKATETNYPYSSGAPEACQTFCLSCFTVCWGQSCSFVHCHNLLLNGFAFKWRHLWALRKSNLAWGIRGWRMCY